MWSFRIGGYQVCEKWLKDRKGSTLSKQDVEHYERILAIRWNLTATTKKAARLGCWPMARENQQ